MGRGARTPLVVGDMPFGSYEVSPKEALRTAIRFVKVRNTTRVTGFPELILCHAEFCFEILFCNPFF